MQLRSTLLAVLAAAGASAALAAPPPPNGLQPVYRRHGDEVESGTMNDMPMAAGGKMNGSMPMPMPVPVAGGPSARGDASLAALAVCGAAGLLMGMMI